MRQTTWRLYWNENHSNKKIETRQTEHFTLALFPKARRSIAVAMLRKTNSIYSKCAESHRSKCLSFNHTNTHTNRTKMQIQARKTWIRKVKRDSAIERDAIANACSYQSHRLTIAVIKIKCASAFLERKSESQFDNVNLRIKLVKTIKTAKIRRKFASSKSSETIKFDGFLSFYSFCHYRWK